MQRHRPDPSFDPTPDQPLGIPVPTSTVVDAYALTIAWSRTEPHRVGECALVPQRAAIIGRGGPRPEDEGERSAFAAMRPGKVEAGGPLAAPTLSRVHVKIAAVQDGIVFERTGKGPVELDGMRADSGLVTPGSTLLLANELLVVCDRRAAQIPDSSLTRTPDFQFGRSDSLRITGESAVTWRLRDQIRFAAGSGAPVLVLGPPGAGKGLVARAVHSSSAGRERPYLVLGGATLTRSDLESLQARTDAPFVVIDEVSDVAPEVQPFLSRLIALTSSLPPPRLRIVATNSAPLVVASHVMSAGPGGSSGLAGPAESIRADLASRFILTVRVPGLDERRADVPLVARAILREIAAEQPEIGLRFFDAWQPDALSGEPRLSSTLVDRLLRHRWQAHVRELSAILWTAMTTATEAWLDATPEVMGQLEASPDTSFSDPNRLEEAVVREALEAAHGKIAVAARVLGLKNRWVLYRLMERLGIRITER